MDLVPGILNLKMTARDQRLTQSLSKMLIGRVLTVFSLMPARRISCVILSSAPTTKTRLLSGYRCRVFSFVDSVSASLTRCNTRAEFPRGKNRQVELGARAGASQVLAARAPTWNNSQWAVNAP